MWADHLVDLRSTDNLIFKIRTETGDKMLDVIIDFVGTDKTCYASTSKLAKGGSVVSVDLFGTTAKIPITMTIENEYKIFGSLCDNYNELRGVIELLNKGRIENNITNLNWMMFKKDINLLKRV